MIIHLVIQAIFLQEVAEMVEAKLSTDKQAATSDIIWRMTSGKSLSSDEEIL